MPHPRQHYEVRARVLTPSASGVSESSALLGGFTGGPEAEQQARDCFTRAGEHMLAGNDAEWFTQYWTEVLFIGPDGQMESIKRPEEGGTV